MQITTCDITPEQAKLWSDTRATLIWHCPAFAHILYTMMNKNGNEHIAIFTRDVGIAACDGSYVLVNPDTFFKLSLMKRIFVVAHEISHGMFGHVELLHKLSMTGRALYPDGTVLPFDAELFQWAMDFVINDMLVVSKIGEIDEGWLHEPSLITHKDDVLVAYRKLYEKAKKQGGKGGMADGQDHFDMHLAPGTVQQESASKAVADRSEMEWKTAIAGAMAVGRAQGKMPSALERLLHEVMEPTVDWRDAVIGYFARKPGSGTYDWRKVDRRFITRNIVAPARSGHGCGTIVVGIDTSGSIDDPVLSVFFGNMAGILDDLRPTRLLLMWCDAKVHRVDEVEDMGDLIDIKMNKGAPGGGGTSFIPVFDKIEDMGLEPDCLIYLTDGMGSFPSEAPPYSVLWGDIMKSKYPFGDVIHVPLKAA